MMVGLKAKVDASTTVKFKTGTRSITLTQIGSDYVGNYVAGETLALDLSSTFPSNGWLFEVTGVVFSVAQGGNQCSNFLRSGLKNPSIVMPKTNTQVTIKAGWATGESQVTITPTIILNPTTVAPTSSPTPPPTQLPTLTPSNSPTQLPSYLPTIVPTAPTQIPTRAPS